MVEVESGLGAVQHRVVRLVPMRMDNKRETSGRSCRAPGEEEWGTSQKTLTGNQNQLQYRCSRWGRWIIVYSRRSK